MNFCAEELVVVPILAKFGWPPASAPAAVSQFALPHPWRPFARVTSLPLTLLAPLLLRYQPDDQFPGFVDRLNFVNLYSIPTEMAKFTSYRE
jgi:hypothetical protein